jgi:uncharacterized SAM-binding protein YcdF (DUF218 family)
MAHGFVRGVWIRVRAAAARFAEVGVAALAVGTLAGLVLDEVRPGAAVHALWMGSTGNPAVDAWLAGAFAAVVLLYSRLAARWPRVTRVGATALGLAVAGVTLAALLRHGSALGDGSLRPAGWAPPLTLVALLLVLPWTVRAASGEVAAPPRMRASFRFGRLVGVGALLAASAIAAMGATDYRAPADAIVVLGARVYADGRPSGALKDRVRTACRLWHAGLAPVLVLSGGRGEGTPVSEPLAMAALALAEGVPEEALLLDESGADTEATVRFAARTGSARGWRNVLVVSHDYHLARIRLLAGREGLAVRTVPAEETQSQSWKTVAFPREVAAYAAAWLSGLAVDGPAEEESCGG